MISRMTFCLVGWFGVGFFVLFCFVLPGWVAFGILVSQPGMELGPPEVETRSPNCWTTREFLLRYINMKIAQFRTVGIVHYFYIKKRERRIYLHIFFFPRKLWITFHKQTNKATSLEGALWENFFHSICFFKSWEFHCLYHFTTPVPLSFLFFSHQLLSRALLLCMYVHRYLFLLLLKLWWEGFWFKMVE